MRTIWDNLKIVTVAQGLIFKRRFLAVSVIIAKNSYFYQPGPSCSKVGLRCPADESATQASRSDHFHLGISSFSCGVMSLLRARKVPGFQVIVVWMPLTLFLLVFP